VPRAHQAWHKLGGAASARGWQKRTVPAGGRGHPKGVVGLPAYGRSEGTHLCPPSAVDPVDPDDDALAGSPRPLKHLEVLAGRSRPCPYWAADRPFGRMIAALHAKRTWPPLTATSPLAPPHAALARMATQRAGGMLGVPLIAGALGQRIMAQNIRSAHVTIVSPRILISVRRYLRADYSLTRSLGAAKPPQSIRSLHYAGCGG